jgi:hypothetical protein
MRRALVVVGRGGHVVERTEAMAAQRTIKCLLLRRVTCLLETLHVHD